ncbi:aminoglycoside phosphotransferase family protein [Streptomyces sp. DSM 42041]|uniref:Aminoglycoside phosphotransferase family protein n=1 Tax=Streptomyces hazeniae TaxID=3075538 RepID=A0ABU2NN39_9ACTN|nr:aminoglycoside phosphotransferase family protein [Streptomyces sp. DSM 42041]MDT0378399.1 aminoglycoside phosphotransferase family protein [Streptomyces sp. DSM 42041]
MTTDASPAVQVLEEACRAVGLDAAGAEPLRIAENQIWRLPGRVVARIARPGQDDAAAREVRVARWLAEHEVSAVRAYPVEQPVQAGGRPVTFWEELPEHRHGAVRDVAGALKQLHSLPAPPFDIGYLDPFVRVSERIDAAVTLSAGDRAWLHQRRTDLEAQWRVRPRGMADRAVHGDAWVGNIARTASGPVLMDLERFSIGPPEWDLVSTAVKLTTTGGVTQLEYTEFCEAYGTDVTTWEGYPLMAAARELRMTTYAAQHAATRPEWQAEAQHRVDCLRGRSAPRPWVWKGIV